MFKTMAEWKFIRYAVFQHRPGLQKQNKSIADAVERCNSFAGKSPVRDRVSPITGFPLHYNKQGLGEGELDMLKKDIADIERLLTAQITSLENIPLNPCPRQASPGPSSPI
jgi:hypothetical protein